MRGARRIAPKQGVRARVQRPHAIRDHQQGVLRRHAPAPVVPAATQAGIFRALAAEPRRDQTKRGALHHAQRRPGLLPRRRAVARAGQGSDVAGEGAGVSHARDGGFRVHSGSGGLAPGRRVLGPGGAVRVPVRAEHREGSR